jgi:hypothetical protein
MLEVSQNSPTHLSDGNIMKVKTFGCLEVAAWDKGLGIVVFWIKVILK